MPDTRNLRHLWAVVSVIETGNLSAAAKAMNLSQPALTQGLNKLEGSFGTALFLRTANGMSPTDAGHILARRATKARALIESPRVTAPQIRAFLALSRHGSYGSAAAATQAKPSSLHRAVRDLEYALSTNLTERRGRGVALTKTGKDKARRFRLALRELDAAEAEIAGMLGQETGRISIGAMPLSRARVLPRALLRFVEQQPAIGLSVVEGSYLELIEPLRDGELDLMIGALRFPEAAPDLTQHRIYEDRLAVFGRSEHPLDAQLTDFITSDLSRYPWIVPKEGVPLRSLWENIFREAEVATPHIVIESGSVMVIREILLETDTLTLLSPDQVRAEIEAGWLKKICDAPPWATRQLGITTRADWHPTPAQSQLIGILKGSAEGL